MSTFAQRVQLGPLFTTGVIQGAAKLYHYEAGTSTLKNIWSDRGMTTPLAQPFLSDADGIWNLFADGLYKIVLSASDDTVLYTLDNWQLIDRTDPTFGEGTVISSASTIAVGPEIFAHISGSTNISTITGTIPFFWAVFDGTLTLVHSSSLLCPGSVNMTVKTGDVLFFLNDGSGVWRVGGQLASSLLVGSETVQVTVTDTRTNTVDVPFTVTSQTTGTPAAGIGTGILVQAESADEAPSNFGQIEFVASDVGSGTEDTYFQVWLRVAGAALSAAYRFVATTAFNAIFTHANTADRTYTLPNESTTLVGTTDTATLTNKTLQASAGASLVWIETLDMSSDNIFNSLGSAYDEHIFQLISVTPGTNAQDLQVTFSTDNGSSFLATGYSHHYAGAVADTNGDTDIPIIVGIASDTMIGGVYGHVHLYEPHSARNKKINWDVVGPSGVNLAFRVAGAGINTANGTAVDAIKFAYASGTIVGTIRHYGVKNA